MAALERDLEGVLAHQRDVLHAELGGVEVLHASETSGSARLAPTFCTGTRPSKALARIAAAVAILPCDDHDLAFAVDVDRERKGVRVFQLRATER